MRNQFADAMRGQDADYIEIHAEESQSTNIAYRGERLEEVGRARSSGGSVRALAKGSWGFVSFNRLAQLWDKVALAVEEAKLTSWGEVKLSSTEL